MICPNCGEEWDAEDLAGFEIYGMGVDPDDFSEYALVHCSCGEILQVGDNDDDGVA